MPLHSTAADLPVERIMHRGLLTCSPDTPIFEAAQRMTSRRCSSMLIMENETAIGIWTEHDSLRLDFNDPTSLQRPISEVMSHPVRSVTLSARASEVMQRFNDEGLRHLLVTDNLGRPQGIVSQTDIALKQGLELYLSLRTIDQVMDKAPLVLAGSLTLGQTAPLMLAHHQDAVVVVCSEQEYGIITERDMVRFVAHHPGNTPLSKLASRPLLTITPQDSLLRARDLLIDNQLRHLAVKDSDNHAIIGLLGFRNILEGADQHRMQELRHAMQLRDQALQHPHLNLQLAERVIAASLEGVIITDAHGRIEFVNPAFTHTTGYSAEEVMGKSPAILSSGRHDADFYNRMWQTLSQDGYWRGEIWNRRKTGQLYLELLTITSISDETDKVTHYAALFADITHIRENEDQIRKLAYYDALTQLPNRRLLEDRLDHALRHAHRQQQRLAVLFIDLDHFKQVNDSLGHAAGDELLLEVSKRMAARLREDDTLARLGGDEFIVLLPDLTDANEVTIIARRLLEAVGEPVLLNNQQFRVGCSVGISLYPDDASNAQQLLQHADAAMYRAKQEGRNTYRLFSTALDVREHRWLAMETALRNALDTGLGLSLHYQPLVAQDSGRLVSMEALARWTDTTFGQVSPGDFIPLAERTGLIQPLSKLLMRTVAAQLRCWLDSGLTPVPVAVNLSAQQFWHQDLIADIQALYQEYRLPAGLLSFELTESILLDKQQQAITILNALRQLGCQIAMDDFGTGYSSLSYLHQLPITTLKIDQSFVQQLGENLGSETILAAITGMAQGLKLTVVAEGVETQAQREALAKYHVDLIQGYLISRPLPANEFSARYLA
ncbi:EAL domain-containing protein [Oceanisphaera sp. IT1-181]|uniref:EAL domain-containing protein n=1 Tax=Oceanisphaera sp. IT1-181 TaxID=3081199 RepID=UPI0029CA8EF8|nr:EAL domain-containing protein [Oceanisphaera sp. IT1-181]